MPEASFASPVGQEALRAVLRSRGFAGAARRRELLEYLFNETLAGRGDALKEFNIGVAVYGRDPATYDTRLDPTVRIDIARLRSKLKEYYAAEGQNDSIRIELPKGSYAVILHTVEATPNPARMSQAKPARQAWITAFAIFAAISLALVGFMFWQRQQRGHIRSVVVLPFRNLTGDPQKDYLADGVTEELTDSLAHIPDLRVVARTSAFEFKDKGIDIRQIGRRLGADTVIEGSLPSTDSRLRLTVQINRSTDGYHILSQTVDGGPQDFARLENEIRAIAVQTVRPGTALAKRKTPDSQAYDLYLRARAVCCFGTRAGFEQAVAYLSQAIQRDPAFADAYGLLAGVYANSAVNLASEPLEYAKKSKAAAAKALELDDHSGQAYAALGLVDSAVYLDWKRGEQELRKAVELMPQDLIAHRRLGAVLMTEGRFSEATAELRKVSDLNPLVANVTLGLSYYLARQYKSAILQLAQIRDLHPDVVAVHPFLGDAFEENGELDKAMAEYSAALHAYPAYAKARIAHLRAVMGKRSEAHQLLNELEHPAPGELPPNAYDIATVYAALGDRDSAFYWLNRAYAERNVALLKVDPFLDPLRDDRRFRELLKRAGLGA